MLLFSTRMQPNGSGKITWRGWRFERRPARVDLFPGAAYHQSNPHEILVHDHRNYFALPRLVAVGRQGQRCAVRSGGSEHGPAGSAEMASAGAGTGRGGARE